MKDAQCAETNEKLFSDFNDFLFLSYGRFCFFDLNNRPKNVNFFDNFHNQKCQCSETNAESVKF